MGGEVGVGQREGETERGTNKEQHSYILAIERRESIVYWSGRVCGWGI